MKQQPFLTSLFLVTIVLALCSCKKDQVPPTVKTPEQILTSTAWEVKELRAVSGNVIVYYMRGGSGNTFRFDDDYIVFKTGGSGIYHQDDGLQYNLTWMFDSADKTKIKYTVDFETPVTIRWENISFNETSIKYDEYYSRGETNTHSSAERTPRTIH